MNEFEELLSSLGVDLDNPFSEGLPVVEIPHSEKPAEIVMSKSVKKVLADFEPEAPKENPLNAVIPEQEEESKEQPEEESREEEVEVNTLDDNSINDVLSDFGFVDESTQPEMTKMERDIIENYHPEEPSVEEDEDNEDDWDDEDEYEENQGEGHDIEQEGIADIEEAEREAAVIQSLDEETIADTPTASSDAVTIPLNSPTLLMDESTSRFSGAEWYNEIQRKRIIIAGQGGIGSNLSFQIARMVPASMILYDNDRVETVNMSGQLFSREDVGKAKVDAVADMIAKYTSMQNVYAVNDQFTNNSEAGDIMMCGFDSMSARSTFFHSWEKHVLEKPDEERKDCLFLDGRLSINDLQVFCIRGNDTYSMHRYKTKYLFKDYEAEETVCSMKQTTYMACMIASVMTNLFVNFVAESLNPILPYDLPFLTQYDAQNMIFKTEN